MIGKGMAISLDQFEVSLGLNEPPRLLAMQWNPEEVAKWKLASFETKERHIGAVATKGKINTIQYFEFKHFF